MPGINFSHQCRNNKEKWPQIRKGHMQAAWRERRVPGRSIRQGAPPPPRPPPLEKARPSRASPMGHGTGRAADSSARLHVALPQATAPSPRISRVRSEEQMCLFTFRLSWLSFPPTVAKVAGEGQPHSWPQSTDASAQPREASVSAWQRGWHLLG